MNNPTLVILAKVIQHGWPEYAKELEDDVKIYFPYRFMLHIVNGIIFIHNRIVVPIGLRHGFLAKLHDNHMGIAKTRLLAHSIGQTGMVKLIASAVNVSNAKKTSKCLQTFQNFRSVQKAQERYMAVMSLILKVSNT